MKAKLIYHKNNRLFFLSGIILLTVLLSCKKAVDAGLPKTQLNTEIVFGSDETAKATTAAIYANMRSSYGGGDFYSVSYVLSFTSDELQQESSGLSAVNILPTDFALSYLWDNPYKDIYAANAILEGLAKPNGVSDALKKQLTGEAKFIRAFDYFYLVNFFGDVPLTLTTDWQANAVMARTPKAQVYQQIITDLKDAQNLLLADYSASNNEKVRPNKLVATALLARVYLYMQDWPNAEAQASAVIDNTTVQYTLPALDQVFLKNSSEAIWQISNDSGNAGDAYSFSPEPDVNYNTPLSPSVVSLLKTKTNPNDPDDQRLAKWTTLLTDNGTEFLFPTKYKNNNVSPITEYSMVMRLAEQYLIRAEARAQQNKVTDIQVGEGNSAESDLNVIRARAGLNGTNATIKEEMLQAIQNERLMEFFTEWGHRWLDLKRTGHITTVLGAIKPNWKSTKELFPIPQKQILNDPAMANQQNPGY